MSLSIDVSNLNLLNSLGFPNFHCDFDLVELADINKNVHFSGITKYDLE